MEIICEQCFLKQRENACFWQKELKRLAHDDDDFLGTSIFFLECLDLCLWNYRRNSVNK